MTERTSREQSITIQVMRLAKPIPSQPISAFCGPSDVDFLNSGNQLIDLPSGQYPIVPHVTSYLNLF
ncbi:unnamed protein product [Meloidogyne enterolobii]|uniref:Uncharacterized protein n=1 Tax=Meloidogyne enterolobii TaxID=390850 RepID=A0ACB0Z7Q8_MELEN